MIRMECAIVATATSHYYHYFHYYDSDLSIHGNYLNYSMVISSSLNIGARIYSSLEFIIENRAS